MQYQYKQSPPFLTSKVVLKALGNIERVTTFPTSGSVQNLGHHHDSAVSCAQPPWKLNVPEQAVGRTHSLHPAPQLPVFQTPSDDQKQPARDIRERARQGGKEKARDTEREREKKGGKRSHWDKHLLWSFPLLSSCLLETKQLHKSISCVFSQHVYYVYNQGHFAGDSSTLFQALVHFLFFPFVFYLLLFFLNKQHQASLFLASADKKLKPSQLI